MMSASAQPNPDRELLVARLEASLERVLKVVRDVPEQRCTRVPGEGRWSVRDVVEHMSLAEAGLLGRLQAAEPNPAPPNYGIEATMQAIALDRSQRRQGSEAVQPTGKFPSLAHAVAAFKQARQKTMDYVRNYAGDLRKVRTKIPLGEVDGHQLVMFMALHSDRHVLQIDEIKNHPLYLK
jgi:uncharacterized damage-inducible protein DinB